MIFAHILHAKSERIRDAHRFVDPGLRRVSGTLDDLGLPKPALVNTLETLEEEVKEETGLDVRFPVDEKGAEVVLVGRN